MDKKTLKDIDVKGKKVFVRVDYNVPFDENQNITNDTRMVRTLPTIILTLVCYIPFYIVNGRSRKAGGMSLGGSKGSRLNVPGK